MAPSAAHLISMAYEVTLGQSSLTTRGCASGNARRDGRCLLDIPIPCASSHSQRYRSPNRDLSLARIFRPPSIFVMYAVPVSSRRGPPNEEASRSRRVYSPFARRRRSSTVSSNTFICWMGFSGSPVGSKSA